MSLYRCLANPNLGKFTVFKRATFDLEQNKWVSLLLLKYLKIYVLSCRTLTLVIITILRIANSGSFTACAARYNRTKSCWATTKKKFRLTPCKMDKNSFRSITRISTSSGVSKFLPVQSCNLFNSKNSYGYWNNSADFMGNLTNSIYICTYWHFI